MTPVGVFDQFDKLLTVSTQSPREMLLWDFYFSYENMLGAFGTLKSTLNYKNFRNESDLQDIIRYADDLSDKISITTKHLIILQAFDRGMGIDVPITMKFKHSLFDTFDTLLAEILS